ncbi:MAG: hypothetical protein AAB493_02680 [Patescibacteria group bacterium]
MIKIKDLLFKFSNLLVSEQIKKESICEVVFKVIGIKLDSKDIKIKNNIIYLNIKPIYKNEIFFKKDIIALKLKESLGKRAPIDLR